MSLIDRKLRRDMLQIRGRILALVVTIAAGVGIFFGIQLALGNLIATQDALLDQMQFADLEVQLLPEDRRNLPDLTNIEGVAKTDTRLVFPGYLDLDSGEPLTTYMIFQDAPQPALNRLELLDGRFWRPGADEVVIDRGLAEFHGYQPGDVIKVKVGHQIFTKTVTGVVMSAEFLVTSSNPEYVVAEPGSVGVVWGDLNDLRASLGFTMVNSLLFQLSPDADRSRTEEAVADAVGKLNVERITPREESYSTKQVRMEVNAFGIYTPAIIATLLILSVAMGIISFRRFAVEKKREFAVLLALGFRPRSILAALARIGLVVGGLGALVGLGIGWGTGYAIAESYSKAMKLPLVIHNFDLGLASTSVLLGLASGLVSIVVACYPLFRRMPNELMRDKIPAVQGSPHFKRWPLILRFSLRDLWRQRELSLASILAMGGAVGVAISYGLAMTSNFNTVDDTFTRYDWDYAVDFRYPLYRDEVSPELKGNGVVHAQPYLRTSTEMRFGGEHAVGILSGQIPGGELHRQYPAMGRDLRAKGEAVISYDLARSLGAGLGDQIVVEKGSKSLDVVIVGITNDIFLRTVTIGLGEAQSLAQYPEKVSGYYLQGDESVLNWLAQKSETVARVTDLQELRTSLKRQMDEKMGIVYITIIFAICVSVVFVTTLMYLSIAEKHGEYAVLMSLGIRKARVRSIILSSVLLQLIAALVFSVPVGIILVHILNARMGEAWYAVNEYYAFSDFALPMASSFIVAPIVGVLGYRAILKLNIPDLLRGRTI